MTLARDASSPAVKLSAFLGTQTASLASNSFTPPAGSIIIVTCWAGDSFQNDWDVAKPTISNSGTALTWNSISSQFNNGLANKSIRTTSWWAFTAAAPGSMTATVAEGVQAGQTLNFMAVAVDVWTGALTSNPIGATAFSNATTGNTRTVAITPTTLGSALVMAGGNWNDATTVPITAGAGCFLLDDANQSVCGLGAGEVWLGSGSSTPTLTTSLSSVNLIATESASAVAWSVVAYEVLPALSASPPVRRYAPGWHPGTQPGMPGGTPFYVPPSAGTPAVAAQTGPPVYPWHGPVRAAQVPARTRRGAGVTSNRTGPLGVLGPPVKPLPRPVRARTPILRTLGRIVTRTGIYGQLGPVVRALSGPVRGRPAVPFLKGRITRAAGAYGQLGPPVRPQGSIRGRPGFPFLKGRSASRAGTYGQLGPPVTPQRGPVRGQPTSAVRYGRTLSRAGTFTAAAPQAGPPVYPLGHPVQAKTPPGRSLGRSASRTGVYDQLGPPLTPQHGPVRPQTPPGRVIGRAQGRAGTFTASAQQAGPPVYPLGHPVRAKLPPGRPLGSAQSRKGVYGQTGPPLRPPSGPVTPRRPGPFRSGRTLTRPGPYDGSGPPVRPLHGPVRTTTKPPPTRGRSRTTLLPPVATPSAAVFPGTVALTNQLAQSATLINILATTVVLTQTTAGSATLTDTAAAAITLTQFSPVVTVINLRINP